MLYFVTWSYLPLSLSLQTFKTTTAGRLVVTLPNKVFAAILKIVPLAPADQADAFVINDLQIFACFEEETTTTTTTPAGTTTVTSTTRVTPTVTITTTTKTTPGGHARTLLQLNSWPVLPAQTSQLRASCSNDSPNAQAFLLLPSVPDTTTIAPVITTTTAAPVTTAAPATTTTTEAAPTADRKLPCQP
jgi:hypothetical protein